MTNYVVSAGYDKDKNCVYLKFYDDKTEKLTEWFDPTFKAYCLADDENKFVGLPVEQFTYVNKYDALHDKDITVVKAEFENPAMLKLTQRDDSPQFWENKIKFQMSYIYDKDIHMGMPYKIVEGILYPIEDADAEQRTDKLLSLFQEKKITRDLIKLFEYPVPNFKRASLDIEVLNESKKIPRPEVANLPIVCICMKTSEGLRICFLLLQPDKKLEKYPDVDELHVFTSEKEMLVELFKFIQQFPFIITFNGDGFDFMYLRNRALRLEVPFSDVPIEGAGISMYMRSSLHIDLYRFFNVNAIRNYAFQGKYKDVDLNTLSKLFLKQGKLNEDKRMVGDMSYLDLVNYCMRDAELTYGLTAFDGNVVMNLIMAISRVSRMPIEEASRKAVGRWIASFLFYLHRRLNYLIPNPEEINEMKGQLATKAVIKGKQFRAAIVITPKGGIYFCIKVVDFGSLYPSIIKLYNIGYETINCPHPECKGNTFAGLPHHICLKKKALESIFIGSLRDLRLDWYKKKAKEKTLTDNEKSWYKCVEQTIKVFMNASFGVFSTHGGFPFYCPSASEEIANIGRSIITATADKAKELGIEVIYGDTDSLMLRETDMTKIKILQDWAIKTYNIDLELDKEYRLACFSGRKKNYLGIKMDGDIDIKGLTGKKSHTPKYFKKTFEEIKTMLKSIQKEEDVPAAKEAIRKLVLSSYQKLKRRQWDSLEDLAFHMTVNKKLSEYGRKVIKNGVEKRIAIPQHIKAVHQLEAAGYAFEAGSMVSFVKTKGGDGVTALELAKTEDIDVDKYLEFLESTFSQILDPLEMELSEIIGHKKLTSFF